MTYGQISDNFKANFPEGRYGEMRYLGGNIVEFEKFKPFPTHEVIEHAMVVYNQNGQTWLFNQTNDTCQIINPGRVQLATQP